MNLSFSAPINAAPQRSYPSETELALQTGTFVAGNLFVRRSAFFGEDLVLATQSFWECAEHYIHVAADRVVIPTIAEFADDLKTVGRGDVEWQHGSERLEALILTALARGIKNVCISLA